MTQEEQNLAVISAWLDCWNRHDVEGAMKFVAEDMRNHGRQVGRVGAGMVMRDILTTFPDQQIKVIKRAAAGDEVMFRATVSATHLGTGRMPVDGGYLLGLAPTGKRYENTHIHWFTLKDGDYIRLEPDSADGLLKSTVFPGLWLDSSALVKLDIAKVLAALARGTASPEHAAFVQKLASQRTSS